MVARKTALLSRGSISMDWLSLYSSLPEEYWRDWQPVLFVEMQLASEWPRWDHHLAEEMSKAGTLVNTQARGGLILLTPHDLVTFSRLFQIAGTLELADGNVDGLILFADGDQQQTARWIECSLRALSRLSEELRSLPWKAVVGPYPNQGLNLSGNTRTTLSSALTIGGMCIEPLNECIVDRSYSIKYPSLSGMMSTVSWPLVVSGTAVGYDSRSARSYVTRDLVLLCSVISLATGTPWVVRELPFTHGDNEIHFAADFYGPQSAYEREEAIFVDLEDWAREAYELGKTDEDFRNALLMHSEALQLEGAHPSVAFIAHMACLQGLGRIVETNRNKQIEAILRKVRGEDDVRRILRYYGHRSETAHRGVLWGEEPVAHSVGIPFNPFEPTDESFDIIMWHVRDAVIAAFHWVLGNRKDLK